MARFNSKELKSLTADKFEFKPYFPGIPDPDWVDPTGPVIVTTPFPGIINPNLDVLNFRPIDTELGEIVEIFDGGSDFGL